MKEFEKCGFDLVCAIIQNFNQKTALLKGFAGVSAYKLHDILYNIYKNALNFCTCLKRFFVKMKKILDKPLYI